MHDKGPMTTRLELTGGERIGETGWPPPARETFGIAEGGKDLFRSGRDFTGGLEGTHGNDVFYDAVV